MTDRDYHQQPAVDARKVAAVLATLDDAETLRRLGMLLRPERDLVVSALHYLGVEVEG